jgi:hypothetical protein
MDEQLTLHELRRLEARRKLRTIPQHVLETTWVRDAQVEAVIDAVLVLTVRGDEKAYAHARHVGEWCARIATALPVGPEPSLARHVGVLARADPSALERIEELKHLGSYVRDLQSAMSSGRSNCRSASAIAMVANEFAARIAAIEAPSPAAILRSMISEATASTDPIIKALCEGVHFSSGVRVA